MNPWLNLVRGRCTAVLDSTFAKSCFEFFPTRAQVRSRSQEPRALCIGV